MKTSNWRRTKFHGLPGRQLSIGLSQSTSQSNCQNKSLESSKVLGNRPLYSCVLSYLAYEPMRGWRWPRFDTDLSALNKPFKNLFSQTAEKSETMWTYDRQAGANGKYSIAIFKMFKKRYSTKLWFQCSKLMESLIGKFKNRTPWKNQIHYTKARGLKLRRKFQYQILIDVHS